MYLVYQFHNHQLQNVIEFTDMINTPSEVLQGTILNVGRINRQVIDSAGSERVINKCTINQTEHEAIRFFSNNLQTQTHTNVFWSEKLKYTNC